ncbi:unnamed protein product [Paramecium sonneborni]|uniref:Uncharacterized protein n=1 Tax=Paramecium sonneborni TaxID=65129 RepID=A0A8S1NVC4_9CILI|nr:unnamed protein product [Paramecium sonneborni]
MFSNQLNRNYQEKNIKKKTWLRIANLNQEIALPSRKVLVSGNKRQFVQESEHHQKQRQSSINSQKNHQNHSYLKSKAHLNNRNLQYRLKKIKYDEVRIKKTSAKGIVIKNKYLILQNKFSKQLQHYNRKLCLQKHVLQWCKIEKGQQQLEFIDCSQNQKKNQIGLTSNCLHKGIHLKCIQFNIARKKNQKLKKKQKPFQQQQQQQQCKLQNNINNNNHQQARCCIDFTMTSGQNDLSSKWSEIKKMAVDGCCRTQFINLKMRLIDSDHQIDQEFNSKQILQIKIVMVGCESQEKKLREKVRYSQSDYDYALKNLDNYNFSYRKTDQYFSFEGFKKYFTENSVLAQKLYIFMRNYGGQNYVDIHTFLTVVDLFTRVSMKLQTQIYIYYSHQYLYQV